jgi:4'-phosphopantetheinyl transferase
MTSSLTLDSSTVHLWRCDLERDENPSVPLDEHERARANAFVFDRDRKRFTIGRRFLKAVLARYLQADYSDVRLSADANGKPRLTGNDELQFNVSHCGPIYVLAVACGEALGIDIERHRAVSDARELGRMVFSPEESIQLDAAEDKSSAFLTGWTRKEAFVKALGIGIGLELRAITVGLAPEPRVVAPIPGVSSRAVAVASLALAPREHVALACAPEITHVKVMSPDATFAGCAAPAQKLF